MFLFIFFCNMEQCSIHPGFFCLLTVALLCLDFFSNKAAHLERNVYVKCLSVGIFTGVLTQR